MQDRFSSTSKKKSFEIRTKNGYDFFEVSSAMQKAIRRGDARTAGFFGLELWTSGYSNYVWKRLYVISAEDCHGIITHEVEALHRAYNLINEGAKSPKGRVFVSKALILLALVGKSRDADHLTNLVYDKISQTGDNEIDHWIEDVRSNPIPIPDYAYDIHTRKGKMMGKTKSGFIKDEHKCLKPFIKGLFDDLAE